MKTVETACGPPESRAGGPREAAHHTLDKIPITRYAEKLNWKRALESALDAVLEAESGDLGLIERNLVDAATSMLAVASEIRRELRQ
jgi:hypothetical protein